MRVGHGFDVHAFGGSGPVVVCGVLVDEFRGVIATSDGDVGAHALADALLGAAALGDIGTVAPPDDPAFEGADSLGILSDVAHRLSDAGWHIVNVDVTVIAQTIRVSPHRDDMRRRLAEALGVPPATVSVKATTTDGLGMLGRDEGLAALATAVIRRQSE